MQEATRLQYEISLDSIKAHEERQRQRKRAGGTKMHGEEKMRTFDF